MGSKTIFFCDICGKTCENKEIQSLKFHVGVSTRNPYQTKEYHRRELDMDHVCDECGEKLSEAINDCILDIKDHTDKNILDHQRIEDAMKTQVIEIPSHSDPEKKYYLSVHGDGSVSCTCRGYEFRKFCSHIEEYLESCK